MLRCLLIILTTVILAGCVRDGKTHYVDGRDHALTVRAEQEYFWKDDITLSFVASRLPDCSRVFPLTSVPKAEIVLSLHSAGNNVWNLRMGDRTWQFETQGCTQLPGVPLNALGDTIGNFTLLDQKLVYTPVKPPAQ
jgi:hypothetical protein